MTDDRLSDTALAYVGEAMAAALGARPLGRHECILVTADDAEPRRLGQTELADELAASGLGRFAKRIRRMVIPADHVLLVVLEDEIRLDVLRVEPEPEPEAVRRGRVSVLGLGALVGAAR